LNTFSDRLESKTLLRVVASPQPERSFVTDMSLIRRRFADQLPRAGAGIVPLGPEDGAQWLMKFVRNPDGSVALRDLGQACFVPLIPGQPPTLKG
jgi:Protein-L-isoaspartate(D-aspartate) O-methyltransferase (PCMT)